MTKRLIVLLFVLALGCLLLYAGAPKLGCCTQVKIMRAGAIRTIEMLGPEHPAGVGLQSDLRDAFGTCYWEGERFLCPTVE